MEPRGDNDSERLLTHVPGLDAITRGGLIRHGVYAVCGAPGAGKTVLANQLCYEQARRGAAAIYLTLMTESHGRMLDNLRGLTFFDRALAGDRVTYLSGSAALRDGALPALLKLIEGEMQRRQPSLLVLDGTCVALTSAVSEQEFHSFVGRLRALCELTGCTALLSLRIPVGADEALLTLADGVLVLRQAVAGARPYRLASLTKFRGSAHLAGEHECDIDARGLTIYPRIESVLGRSPGQVEQTARCELGIEGLDAMLRGGLPASSSTLLVGPPGSGKTLVGLSFLAAGATRGERGLHFGFYEHPSALAQYGESIGLPLREHQRQGLLDITWRPPFEQSLDRLLGELMERVRDGGFQRVFLDGYDAVRLAAPNQRRVHAAVAAVTNELRALAVTTAIAIEGDIIGRDLLPEPPTSALMENAILLRYAEIGSDLRRLVSVVKVRGSDHDSAIRQFHISPRGLSVAGPFAHAESLLSGLAHRIGPTEE